jgi:hypothetical protein
MMNDTGGNPSRPCTSGTNSATASLDKPPPPSSGRTAAPDRRRFVAISSHARTHVPSRVIGRKTDIQQAYARSRRSAFDVVG